MNKNLLTALIVLGVIVIGAGAYYYGRTSVPAMNPVMNQPATNTVPMPGTNVEPGAPSGRGSGDIDATPTSPSTPDVGMGIPPQYQPTNTGGLGSDAPAVTVVTVPPVDSSWMTSVSSDRGFHIRFPSSGRYVPDHEISYLASTDAHVHAMCYVMDGITDLSTVHPQHIVVGGIATCQTTFLDGAAGSTYRTDVILVPLSASRYAMVTLRTRYLNDPQIVDGCEPGGRLVGTPTCAPFDANYYGSLALQIWSTFGLGAR